MTNIATHHISRDTLHSTGFQLGPIYSYDSFPTDWAGFWSLKNISKQYQITRYIGWMQSWSPLSILFIWLSVHRITLNIVNFFCMLAISVHFSEIVPLSPPGFILSLPLRAHECEDSYVSCNIQPEHSISKAGYMCTPFNWLAHSRRTFHGSDKMATRHVTTSRINLQFYSLI